jgi:hypothetical protein
MFMCNCHWSDILRNWCCVALIFFNQNVRELRAKNDSTVCRLVGSQPLILRLVERAILAASVICECIVIVSHHILSRNAISDLRDAYPVNKGNLSNWERCDSKITFKVQKYLLDRNLISKDVVSSHWFLRVTLNDLNELCAIGGSIQNNISQDNSFRVLSNFFSTIRSISPEKVATVRKSADRKGPYHSNLNVHSQFGLRFFHEAFQPPI